MKIIKEGTGQKGWAREYTCSGDGNGGGGCGAVLLVEADDLMNYTKVHLDGSTTAYVLFKCCCCGVLTDVYNSDSRSSSNDRDAARHAKRRYSPEHNGPEPEPELDLGG